MKYVTQICPIHYYSDSMSLKDFNLYIPTSQRDTSHSIAKHFNTRWTLVASKKVSLGFKAENWKNVPKVATILNGSNLNLR